MELPQGQWKELVPILLQNVTDPSKTPFVKQGSLDTIGYICEEIVRVVIISVNQCKDPEVLRGVADQILTAVVHGMRAEETDTDVKKSACGALLNALSFCRQNFENPQECQVLMSVILDATVHADQEIRLFGYYILVEVAGLHYDKLAPFMQRIFKVRNSVFI